MIMHSRLRQSQRRSAPVNRLYRLLLPGFVIVLSIVSPAAFASEDSSLAESTTTPGDVISVEFQDGLLSVSAEQAPIVELMQTVADEADFEVTAYGDLSRHLVSISFARVKLKDALKWLLRDTSAIVSYRDSGETRIEPQIARIFLLGTSSAAAKSNPIRVETLAPDPGNNLRASEIRSTDSESRIASIERTAGMNDSITLENLAFSLNHDPDPGVRLKAITAIGEIGGPAAAGMLEPGLGDKDPLVRKTVVQTLGGIEDERIPFWLGQVLMGDPSPEVRLVAVRSIARQEGVTAKIFLEAATGDKSSAVSDAALELLR